MGIKFEEAGHIGYKGHNGGFQFRQISDSEYEYKATIQDFHLNSGGITHGGFIMTLMDSGLGTSVYQSLGGEKKIDLEMQRPRRVLIQTATRASPLQLRYLL